MANSGTNKINKTGLNDRTFLVPSMGNKRCYSFVCNTETNVSRWSDNAVEYFNLPGEYIENGDLVWLDKIHPDDRVLYQSKYNRMMESEEGVFDFEYQIMNAFGDYILVTCKCVVLPGKGKQPKLLSGTILNHGIQESIDPITYLHTSSEFIERIKRMVNGKETGVIYKISISRFNNYNILYGFEFGDSVLKAVSETLRSYVAGKGHVYRLEGAKFAVILFGVTEEIEIHRIYEKIKDQLADDVYLHGMQVPVHINGAAFALDESFSGDDVMIRSALTYSLAKSKDELHGELVTTDTAHDDSVERVRLISLIHKNVLLGCTNFHMVYQPLVNPLTEEIRGAEALVRYTDPDEGEIPPGKFIAWLEEDPVFYKLGMYIMRTAMTEMEPAIRTQKGFVLNINVTASQFKNPSFRDDVSVLLKEFNYPKNTICLELTERCRQMDVKFLCGEISYFKSLGVMVSLDDFGTGSSSMAVVRDIPVDEIKIDMSFVKGIDNNKVNQSLVKTIIYMAGEMGMKSCIEGVENMRIAEFLREYNATYFQGYHYSRPVDIEHFLGMLKYE